MTDCSVVDVGRVLWWVVVVVLREMVAGACCGVRVWCVVAVVTVFLHGSQFYSTACCKREARQTSTKAVAVA
jgi:predicted nucleic acid-binding Zn ribbon protein